MIQNTYYFILSVYPAFIPGEQKYYYNVICPGSVPSIRSQREREKGEGGIIFISQLDISSTSVVSGL